MPVLQINRYEFKYIRQLTWIWDGSLGVPALLDNIKQFLLPKVSKHSFQESNKWGKTLTSFG